MSPFTVVVLLMGFGLLLSVGLVGVLADLMHEDLGTEGTAQQPSQSIFAWHSRTECHAADRCC